MQLRQVEYAVAIADLGSFTAAARTLHVTQSALSQGIRSLERELGTELFARRRGEVSATAAGEAFVAVGRRILHDVRIAKDAVDSVVAIVGGRLDMIVAPAFAAGPLGPVLGTFRTRYPGVSLRIEPEEETDAIIDGLVRGRAELGFAQLPLNDSMRVIRSWTEEIWLVSPPGGFESGPVAVTDVLDAPLVAPSGAAPQIRRLWEAAGASANIAVECGAHELVVPLVLAGAGVAFQPESMALAAAALGASVQPLEPAIAWHTALFASSDVPLSPAACAFVDIALDSSL